MAIIGHFLSQLHMHYTVDATVGAFGAYSRTASWLREISIKVVLEIHPVVSSAFRRSHPLHTIAESQHSFQ